MEPLVPNRDTQLVELAGRHRLISELVAARLEVAEPIRDRGVDLIAYAELSERIDRFVARPIQVKASSKTGFSIDRKYEKISDLILAFVWHVADPKMAVTYALSYPQAVQIAEIKKWTETASWKNQGIYSVTKPGKDIVELLEPHRMNSDKWWPKVTGQIVLPRN
jgi:hypothetical protein